MTRTRTRQKLIEAGSEIFAELGFNNTGINTVLSRARVPKGSFYHYFSSKQDFGLAVIDDFAKQHSEVLTMLMSNQAVSPLQRMRNYLEYCLKTLIEYKFRRGCIIGNLSQELAAQNADFRHCLAAVFEEWKQHYMSCLEAAIQAGELDQQADCEQLAELLLTGCQGAMLMGKVKQSAKPMQNFIEFFFELALRKNNQPA